MKTHCQRSIFTTPYTLLIMIPLVLGLTKCEEFIIPFELIDPAPGAYDQFGDEITLLANGNIVVADPGDSSVAPDNGAIHIYNPRTQELLNSFYGSAEDDRFGLRGITPLSNGNFMVVSYVDDVDGLFNAGTIRLVDGATGNQIGDTIKGDADFDYTEPVSVVELANGNVIISAPFETENGVPSVGSVRLINTATGLQIGDTLVGNEAHDNLGSGGITALANSNFVIASPSDKENGINRAGSVRLINGATGVEIGDPILGDSENASLGYSGTTALANNNFVIASSHDNNGVTQRAGSVKLVSGTTGIQIGATIKGDFWNDRLGSHGAVALPNNNFVIVSIYQTKNNKRDLGSIRLVDGSTSLQIGDTIMGDVEGDALGSGGITVLGNNNFVIASPRDDENGMVNAGSARLIDGATGVQIGETIVGESADDGLTLHNIAALANDNFVIASAEDNEGGIRQAGSVMLINGNTGAQIGNTIAGDTEDDQLGREGIIALGNNNFVIASSSDDENGIVDVGSVRLINGTTGAQIGATITGDQENDHLGTGGVVRLVNHDFIVLSPYDDRGSVKRISGTTAIQVGKTRKGKVSGDMYEAAVTESPSGDFYVLSFPWADHNGEVDAGFVRVVIW